MDPGNTADPNENFPTLPGGEPPKSRITKSDYK